MNDTLHKFLNAPAVVWLINVAHKHHHRFFVALICLLMVFSLLCLLSYNETDAAWSYVAQSASDPNPKIANVGGVGGAWLADILYRFFGVGAWAWTLWLVCEAVYVGARAKRAPLALRLLAYLFLWLCLCALLHPLSPAQSDVFLGGIAGYEVSTALTATLGQAGAVGFLLFAFAGLVALLVYTYFSKKSTLAAPKTPDARPKTDPAPKPVAPPSVHSAPNSKDALGEFLAQSGLGDDLATLRSDWQALSFKQSAQKTTYRNTTPSAPPQPAAPQTPSDASDPPTQPCDPNAQSDKTARVLGQDDANLHTQDPQGDKSDPIDRGPLADVPFFEIDLPKSRAPDPIAAPKPDLEDNPNQKPASFAMQTAQYRQSLSALPDWRILDPKSADQSGYSPLQLQRLSDLLEIKLQEFGIKAEVMNVVQGPVVTSFEVQLAAGVKASKVTGVAQDLARSLAMVSLRVVEVIAGKPYIGIEIPNQNKQTVKLIELLGDAQYQDPNNQIAIAMGKDIGGKAVIADLAKAPHMLVAGTTGSGKSVLVNSLLLSMLLKYTPDELRLILIDPKMLELANYADIPHLLTPVVTDMAQAASALSWCVTEMERRYRLMAMFKVRKLSEFNKKVREAVDRGEPLFDPLWRQTDSASQDKPPKLAPLPLIVVVADEFADMIMQVGKQAEELITRLAQKSRAAGIHLVLATQRPSVDVITGLIKANIPSRAALRVNSKVDSRTILDASGAEDMLGHGDMLFLAPGKNEPIRVHGAYVSDEEVNRVTDAWRERGYPDYIDTVTRDADNFSPAAKNSDQLDALYDEVLAFMMESGRTSTSAVQRKFSIGYPRAAKIIDSMEEQGALSAPDHTGKRTLLL